MMPGITVNKYTDHLILHGSDVACSMKRPTMSLRVSAIYITAVKQLTWNWARREVNASSYTEIGFG